MLLLDEATSALDAESEAQAAERRLSRASKPKVFLSFPWVLSSFKRF